MKRANFRNGIFILKTNVILSGAATSQSEAVAESKLRRLRGVRAARAEIPSAARDRS